MTQRRPPSGCIVLIGAKDPFEMQTLVTVCEGQGLEVVTALDGDGALNLAARGRPSLAILDASLRADDGAELVPLLRADPSLRSMPILLAVPAGDAATQARATELGVDDLLERPFRIPEVARRLRLAVRLARAERALSEPPSAPPPAGDGRQLYIALDYEASRALRYGHRLSCILVWLPGVSAEATKEIEPVVRGSIRVIDLLFRAGPGELVVLLPETDAVGAEVVEGRLTAALAARLPGGIRFGRSTLEGVAEASGVGLLRAARARAGATDT